ncbi:MAG TPA: histidine phosphatase family protein [Candidatus Polarisedimenticolia bacterium]|nr:histidine phosphatase family protein [Candidatus Polarisedimenticolia bacterium]
MAGRRPIAAAVIMKTLLLLRHGKSSWDAQQQLDHDRPLAKRGRKAAALMGRYLTALDEAPEYACSSSAVRARDTAGRAAQAGGWSCRIEISEHLYHASPDQVLEVVRKTDGGIARLLLAGHEPTWSLLTGRLIGSASVRFPTAAVARIDLSIENWREADFGRGTLVWLVTPKILERIGWEDALS